MSFSRIRYTNFRNLATQEIDLQAPVVFLVGENGQGKTNFIEAIYYSCYGSSFRVKTDKAVIHKEKEHCIVKALYNEKAQLTKEIEVRIDRKHKEILVDSKRISDRKVLLENLPCILFSHGDLALINGAPAKRRWFFNQTLCLFDILFVDLSRNYTKILKNRNIVLKERKIELLDVYDQRLVVLGKEIQKKRKILTQAFNRILSPLYRAVSETEDELKLVYRPSWSVAEDENRILEVLQKSRDKDLHFAATTSGPQRDNFLFFLNGRNFADLGSTGQMRLVSLILKIAQARFVLEKKEKKPVLLLDDVLLEMDAGKRKRIMANLPEFEQAFFAFLPTEDFQSYSFTETLVYNIKGGILEKWKKPERY